MSQAVRRRGDTSEHLIGLLERRLDAVVYRMRFDEASAIYALFGPFYVGLRFDAHSLGTLMQGRTPAFNQG